MTSLDGINGRLVQMLWRGENDLKQSDEIQAREMCNVTGEYLKRGSASE